ncbi:MAG TPA: DUF3105 domain-containing protein [Chloroflexia bacterium]|nr:DUF3105 domain-containing protein [Chloroflexia bacterium]
MTVDVRPEPEQAVMLTNNDLHGPLPRPVRPVVEPYLPAEPPVASRANVLGPALSVVLLLGALVTAGLSVYNPFAAPPCTRCGKILEFPSQGNTHIQPGEAHPPYNSDPATSGWHREEFPPTEQADIPVAVEDEVSVHMLEHGMFIAWYSCPPGPACDTIRRNLVQEASRVVAQGDAPARLYVMPRASLPDHAVIALGAWQYLEYLDHFDAAAVDAFLVARGAAVQGNGVPAAPTVPPNP